MLGFAAAVSCFWSPAHSGIDQNGYLVGGKMIAAHFSTGFKPTDPFQFVGGMWILADNGWYYPKYPIGLPLLNAIALWLDPDIGDPHGRRWVMMISPICTALSLLGMFLLVRLIAGSFFAILGMILLATSMTTLAIANSPWSHTPALCFVTWGMYLLLRWWQTGSIWCGIPAGFLLGYAVTIRYTEGLLILPIMLVCFSMIRIKQPGAWLRATTPALAWLVPVLVLVTFNKLAMGTWTGYDSTNESTGFTLDNFRAKWEFMVQQIYDYGLFFIVPLAVLGMVSLYRASWKAGLFLTLWIVPGIAIYTAYYWGMGRMGGAGVGYLRFFLTLFPAMIAAACWCMSFRAVGSDRRSVAVPIGCGVIVTIAAAVGLRNALPSLSREHAVNTNLAYTTDEIARAIPRGSVIIADRAGGGINQLLNFLQFRIDGTFYSSEAFTLRPIDLRRPDVDADQPNPMQPARRKYLQEHVYKNMSQTDLDRERNRIIGAALRASKRVFVIMPVGSTAGIRGRVMTGGEFDTRIRSRWKEPAVIPADRAANALQPVGFGQDRTGRPGPQEPPRGARAQGPGRHPQSWQIVELIARAPTEPSAVY